MVAADDSPTAKRAIEAATEMVLVSGGTLHIVAAFTAKQRTDRSLPDEFKHVNNEGE